MLEAIPDLPKFSELTTPLHHWCEVANDVGTEKVMRMSQYIEKTVKRRFTLLS